MFFEQYDHEPAIAVVCVWLRYSGRPEAFADRLEERTAAGYRALGAMERHLDGRSFLVGERYSLADISLHAYTHVAHEGGFDLERYPAIRSWLERVAAWCHRFTPIVSLEVDEELLLEVKGSVHLFGGIEALRERVTNGLRAQGFDVRLGLASTPRGALWLARNPSPQSSQELTAHIATRNEDLARCLAPLTLRCLRVAGGTDLALILG